MASGDFQVEVDDLLINVLASAIMTAVSAQVRGVAGPEAGARVAELQLRMLGVAPERAAAIAGVELAVVRLPG